MSKSTIVKLLHECKCTGFTTGFTPLVTRKKKAVAIYGEKTVWTDETETYQNDGKKKVWRRRKTGHVWRQTTLSVTHGGGNVACTGIAASGTSSLVFIYDGTSDRK